MTIIVKTRDEELLIGRLTGFRCNHCGACIFVSLSGSRWCPNCGAGTLQGGKKILPVSHLEFAPIPNKKAEFALTETIKRMEHYEPGAYCKDVKCTFYNDGNFSDECNYLGNKLWRQKKENKQ